MKLAKLTRAFILGLCAAMLLSTAAFAESGSEAGQTNLSSQDAVTVDAVLLKPDADREISPVAGQGESGVVPAQKPVIDSEILERLNEIDEKVFKTHAADIREKEFMVTHTACMDGYVEVGISPYSEENANFLYELLGKDKIKIVEGQQVMLLADGGPDATVSSPAVGKAPDDGSQVPYVAEPYVAEDSVAENSAEVASDLAGEVRALAANEPVMEAYAADDNSSSAWNSTQIITVVLAAAAVVILGCAVVIKKKLKAAGR